MWGSDDYVTFQYVRVCWLEVQESVSVLFSCIEAPYCWCRGPLKRTDTVPSWLLADLTQVTAQTLFS